MADTVVLVHGAATTSSVWSLLLPHLAGLDVLVPDRPCTGDLALEMSFLRPLVEGAFLVGVGGGATLGLALLGAGLPLAGALLHEPAVGSLVPGLLAPVAAAFASGGVAAFGSALYGPAWTMALAPSDPEDVRRDLGMFRGFEPSRPLSADRVLTTVGGASPVIRHEVARVLAQELGLESWVLEGCGHAVHLEQPEVLADVVRRLLAE